jgi:hypothetical protein
MLTKESADVQVQAMSDTELNRAADQVTGRHDDQDLLATRAVVERVRRTEQAEQAARLAAPGIAAERAARSAYESLNLPAEKFTAWYQERLQQAAHQRADDERATAAHRAKGAF